MPHNQPGSDEPRRASTDPRSMLPDSTSTAARPRTITVRKETLSEITSLKDLVSGQTLVVFVLLGLFALLPTLYKQLKARKANGALAVLLLAGALASPSGPVKAAASYEQFLGLYGSLLEAYVRPSEQNSVAYNGVDYDRWSADVRHQKALTALQESDPAQFGSQAEQMAFSINAYNFLTIDLIVREDERDSIKNLGSLFTSPWRKYEWTIAGQSYTLDQIEHEILRPMGDARIHFAINCAALSCPDLRDEPYKASILDAQLDEQVRLTLNNPSKGFRMENEVVYVTKVMDWFSEDFDNGDLSSWLSRNLNAPLDQNTRVDVMNYDWSLNKTKEQ